MDFKILELKFKDEIIESINNNTNIISFFELLQVTSINQLLEIEQNINNDSLDPFPKNFNFIKINLHGICWYNLEFKYMLLHVLKLLISDDYVYEPKLSGISYKNKNIANIHQVTGYFYDCSLRITYNNETYNRIEENKVCDFFVPRLPCFVHIDCNVIIEMQKSYNVIPIKQFDYLYYLKPIGLLTKAAIKNEK